MGYYDEEDRREECGDGDLGVVLDLYCVVGYLDKPCMMDEGIGRFLSLVMIWIPVIVIWWGDHLRKKGKGNVVLTVGWILLGILIIWLIYTVVFLF